MSEQTTKRQRADQRPGYLPNEWDCPSCGTFNASRKRCLYCLRQRPAPEVSK